LVLLPGPPPLELPSPTLSKASKPRNGRISFISFPSSDTVRRRQLSHLGGRACLASASPAKSATTPCGRSHAATGDRRPFGVEERFAPRQDHPWVRSCANWAASALPPQYPCRFRHGARSRRCATWNCSDRHIRVTSVRRAEAMHRGVGLTMCDSPKSISDGASESRPYSIVSNRVPRKRCWLITRCKVRSTLKSAIRVSDQA